MTKTNRQVPRDFKANTIAELNGLKTSAINIKLDSNFDTDQLAYRGGRKKLRSIESRLVDLDDFIEQYSLLDDDDIFQALDSLLDEVVLVNERFAALLLVYAVINRDREDKEDDVKRLALVVAQAEKAKKKPFGAADEGQGPVE